VERTQSTPAWLWATGVLFIAAIATVVVSSLRRPEPPVFSISGPEALTRTGGLIGPDTITLDARSGDRWTLFDLETGRVVTEGDTWDVGVKRHRLMANGGPGFSGNAGAVRLELPFEDVHTAPREGYTQSRVTPGGDTVHAVLDAWYSYDFFSHLLEPDPVTFAFRTADNRYAKLRVLAYYCPGPEPGCMTIEYSFLEEGSRRAEMLQ
jgi:hypothetical protein